MQTERKPIMFLDEPRKPLVTCDGPVKIAVLGEKRTTIESAFVGEFLPIQLELFHWRELAKQQSG